MLRNVVALTEALKTYLSAGAGTADVEVHFKGCPRQNIMELEARISGLPITETERTLIDRINFEDLRSTFPEKESRLYHAWNTLKSLGGLLHITVLGDQDISVHVIIKPSQ